MKFVTKGMLLLCCMFIHVSMQASNKPQISYYELQPSCMGWFVDENTHENFAHEYRKQALQNPILKDYRKNVSHAANCAACVVGTTILATAPQPWSCFAATASVPATRHAVVTCCNALHR